jgi:hypothetical protein
MPSNRCGLASTYLANLPKFFPQASHLLGFIPLLLVLLPQPAGDFLIQITHEVLLHSTRNNNFCKKEATDAILLEGTLAASC